ncbi:uncharacterized protein C8A04DRAFT_39155 [Dichotomopilus funicola]|uniref:Infection structure specific protein n=1 Tax=Dichotomopilus funicola TaxID=1934379 RepID=A0AAN6UYD4_9PEZI|nr:hypothetical protein C8A04DRAFT_39155 [Dichotomopilus funicola]
MHTTALLTALAGVTLSLANPAPHPAAITPAPILHPAAPRFIHPRNPSWLDDNDNDNDDDDGDNDNDNSDDNNSYIPATVSKVIECATKYASLADTAPRETNIDLARWYLSDAITLNPTSHQHLDDSLTTLCDPSRTATRVPPASLSSAWSTHQSKASAWISSIAPAAHSLASSCGGEYSAAAEALVVSDGESCTKAVLGYVAVFNGDDDDGVSTTGGSTGVTRSGSGTATETGGGASETGGSGSAGTGSDGGNGASETTRTSTGGVPRETGFVGAAAAAVVAVVGVVAAL